MRHAQKFAAFAALALLLVVATPAEAAIQTLTDLNSTVRINDASSAGMFDWLVDGVDQMFQQWFWYRIGTTGGESAINTISGPVSTTFLGTRGVDIRYQNAQLAVQVTYTLTGGTAGSMTSDVAETIRITNLTAGTLDLHFFQYSDFDLNNQTGGQTATFISPQAFQQSGGGLILSETVATPAPSRHEANVYANTLNSLSDGSPTTLNNVNTAFGDATWAFQWDTALGAGSAFLISKDKRLASAIPEPMSVLLLGTTILGLTKLIRRRTAA